MFPSYFPFSFPNFFPQMNVNPTENYCNQMEGHRNVEGRCPSAYTVTV